MKYILHTLTVVFVSLLSSSTFGQVSAKAEKLYSDLAYVDAIATLERQYDKGNDSPEVLKKLGDSYYFNANLPVANKWYELLFAQTTEVTPEYYYRYSQTLKSIGNYKKADEYQDKFYKISSSDYRAIKFNEERDYKAIIDKVSGRYTIKNVNINTVLSDYGSAYYGNQVVFSSTRETRGVSKSVTQWTENEFSDLYAANINETGDDLNTAQSFSKTINTKFHEDTPVFTKDGKTVYFTRNNYTNRKIGKDEENFILLKLYKAKLVADKWVDIVEVPFNSDDYSVSHPALSADEKTLYFASDMPGTKGLSDLFKVAITGDNTYGTPVNLTGGLNTEGRETFPYITSDNELYFASNGLQGLGGLDIFVTKLGDDGMPQKIYNVGAPINSSMDDFCFVIDKKTSTGFFSSNREGGKGLDDIYSFKENKKLDLECKQSLSGVVTSSETGDIIADARVVLLDADLTEIGTTRSDASGVYNFPVVCEKMYYVRAEKAAYETAQSSITIPNVSGKSILPLVLVKKPVELAVGKDLAKELDIPIIYFDLDKWFIRPDAAKELSKVLKVMQDNPEIKIDVRSHTDCRQTAGYNERLSDRRAKSTVAWLVKNGIAKNRLTGKGYGETQLVNSCSCEPTNDSSCSEAEHQLNRRSEFIIVSLK